MEKCKQANQASLDCVAQYQKQEYLDQERDLFIKEKIEKKKLYKQKLKELQEQKEGKEIWQIGIVYYSCT